MTNLQDRLNEAVEMQKNSTGENVSTPTVCYCFECDEISVDTWYPDGCDDHHVVTSDGYEHGGIQAALTAIEYIES